MNTGYQELIQIEELAHTVAMEVEPFLEAITSKLMTLMLLRPLFKRDQFLLQSMLLLLLSPITQLELLPPLHVELRLITVLWPSDTELKTEMSSSSSKINGAQLGVTMVTSRSVPAIPTFAVSSLPHLKSQSHETENYSNQIMF